MKFFKIARIKKDLTQQKLSEMTGMSIATINKIEKGTKSIDSMKVENLKKICEILDLDIIEVINKTY